MPSTKRVATERKSKKELFQITQIKLFPASNLTTVHCVHGSNNNPSEPAHQVMAIIDTKKSLSAV
jgi:hypothetical protein